MLHAMSANKEVTKTSPLYIIHGTKSSCSCSRGVLEGNHSQLRDHIVSCGCGGICLSTGKAGKVSKWSQKFTGGHMPKYCGRRPPQRLPLSLCLADSLSSCFATDYLHRAKLVCLAVFLQFQAMNLWSFAGAKVQGKSATWLQQERICVLHAGGKKLQNAFLNRQVSLSPESYDAIRG